MNYISVELQPYKQDGFSHIFSVIRWTSIENVGGHKIDFKLFEIFRKKVQVHSTISFNLKEKLLLTIRKLLTMLMESKVGSH